LRVTYSYNLLIKFLKKMKALFGAIIVDGSGKSGGHVFTKGRTGNNMRIKRSPRQPVSNFSSARRSKFTSVSKLWKTLLVAVINQWNAAAKEIKLSGNFGKSYSPSGFQLFSTLNNNLGAINVVPISAVPAAATVATMTSMSVVVTKGSPLATLTYAPAVPATAAFVLEATDGIPQSRQVRPSDFRQIGVLLTASSSPFDMTSLYTAKYGAVPAIGTTVYVRVRPVHLTAGWGGQPFGCSTVIAT
jgi:hypothetical protein